MSPENLLDDIKKRWQAESDKYILEAANQDISEYSDEIKEIILEEAFRRGLINEQQHNDTNTFVAEVERTQEEKVCKKSKKRIILGIIISLILAAFAYLYVFSCFASVTESPDYLNIVMFLAVFIFYLPLAIFFTAFGVSLILKKLNTVKILGKIYWWTAIILGIISFAFFAIGNIFSGSINEIKTYLIQLLVSVLVITSSILIYATPIEIGYKGLRKYLELNNEK